MELRLIDRTDRARTRLDAALALYRETILPEAQNPERQILYWIDHSKDNLSDEFRCFAIEHSKGVVGYLQYSYFREEHIFFFEYLCIRDAKRLGLIPSKAVRSIEDYLAQNYRPGFTIVFEVAHQRNNASQWERDKKLTEYFKRLGFRSVDFAYRYPILQSYDGETSYPADLMIRLPEGREVISQSEMRTILRCIYFKHYLRWDRPFLEPERFSERERLIDELYSRQVAQIHDRDSFGTMGDNTRSRIPRFTNHAPRLTKLIAHVFRPKLIRLVTVILLLLFVRLKLNNDLLLIPFVLLAAALYCLAEDTATSRKIFVLIMSRLRIASPRSS